MIYLAVIAILILDRIVKYMIWSNMYPGETIPVIDGIFHITYVQNQGAAFSMWENQWVALVLLPAAAISAGLILLFVKRKVWPRMLLMAIACICGGGLGNLIDRIAMGYVVDLFDFRVFPVFNVADIFICLGCGLLLIYVIFFERKYSSHGPEGNQ